MRIEFDTQTITPTEATALSAFLAHFHTPTQVIKTKGTWSAPENAGTLVAEIREKIGGGGITHIPDEAVGGTAPTTVATGALDSANMPWDERIHSSSRETKADGTWRLRRGVDKDLVPVVEAELRAAAPAPESEPEAAAPSPEEAFAPAPPVPTTEVAIPAPPAAPVATGVSFIDMMHKITEAQAGGKVSTDKVKELCAAVGATSVVSLNGADKAAAREQFLTLLAMEVAG